MDSVALGVFGRVSKLMEGMSDRSPACIAEVVQLLKFERETWEMVLAQLATAEPDAMPDGTEPSTDAGSTPGDRLHLAG